MVITAPCTALSRCCCYASRAFYAFLLLVYDIVVGKAAPHPFPPPPPHVTFLLFSMCFGVFVFGQRILGGFACAWKLAGGC